jgi:hypothetical protein
MRVGDIEKAKYIEQSSEAMRQFLRSKTWVEKVRSIERMNEMSNVARDAMQKALEKQIK